MKNFKILFVALVAMIGLNSCSEDCDHNYTEHDHSEDLVGTWTYMDEDFAEALVISADGSVVSTRLFLNEYRENIKGKIVVENGDVNLTFEDGGNFKSHFDIIPGMAFTIFNEEGERLTYKYCANDLSDEIVGMWVCNGGVLGQKGDITIQTFKTDGKAIFTGGLTTDENEPFLNIESTYKVIGDLAFQKMAGDLVPDKYQVFQMTYAPDGTSAGDIMVQKMYLTTEKGTREETVSSWLRIKQHLELPGTKYDYIKTFVTNVKGEDKDIPFLNTSFNFAKMDGSIIDKFLKSILFTVEFPEANKIKYSYLLEGKNIVIDAPIEVDGNKMTIKMSANNPAYQDVDMYAFQDQDNTQMHWYMPTTSFEKFFGNTSVALMLGYGQLDKDDTEGIANVYKTIADAVESINLSIVMSQSK